MSFHDGSGQTVEYSQYKQTSLMIHGVLICFYTSPGDMPRVYNVYTCAVQEEF